MPQASDNFPALWQSLSDHQRRFLLAAYEIDKDLPHTVGCDRVVPILRWRTVGVMCGLKGDESDEAVQTLAGLGLISIFDAPKRQFVLTCSHRVGEIWDERRKRRWNWVLLAAATLGGVPGVVRS